VEYFEEGHNSSSFLHGAGATSIPPTPDRRRMAASVGPLGKVITLAGLLFLVACGGSTLTPSPSAVATSAIMATPPIPTSVRPPLVTALPNTATPLPPTATAFSPTSTAPPPTVTVAATTIAPATPVYTANFASWFSGSVFAPLPFRASFEPTSGEYRLALSDARRGYVYYRPSPDERTFEDFRLDIDARRVAGPDNGVYGVVFRIQPPITGAATFERYNFTVTPDGFYALTLIKADGTATAIAPRAISSAIRKGDAANHLTIVAKGNQLTLTINGQAIGTFSGPIVDPGGIGVYVGNPPNSTSPVGMEAGFSNLRVSATP